MRLGLVGGIFVVAGCVLLAVAALLAASGESISVASRDRGGIVAGLALGLIGSGVVLLGAGGAWPLHGRLIRSGLVMTGLGVGAVLATSGFGSTSPPVVVLVAGGIVAQAGVIATVVGLLKAPGRARLIGVAFIVGLGMAIVAGAMTNGAIESGASTSAIEWLTTGLIVIGGGVVLGAVAGLGVLGIVRRGTTGQPAD